jgi:hypothetical protein
MKNFPSKIFKKKTNKLYSFNLLSESDNLTETTVGDPTNTIITTLTTASGQTHFGRPLKQMNFKI